MKKWVSRLVTTLMSMLGICLIAISAMSSRLRSGGKGFVLATLGGGALALLVTGIASSRTADKDYRKVIATLLYALTVGMLLQAIFFAWIWMLLSERAVGVLLAVMPGLYGLAMLMAAITHHFMSHDDYREFAYDFFRQLPYLYYRYRT